jgi:hypothetical protein
MRAGVLAAVVAAGLVASSSPARAQSCEDQALGLCATNSDCREKDGVACTVPTCDDSGQCVEVDACRQTCRTAAFWGAHSGIEGGGANLGQALIDTAGPFVVCGHMIRSTDTGNLNSALEGLCVRAGGLDELRLFRELTAAAMNCAISEGGRCDQVLHRYVDVGYDDCNSLCAGEPRPGGPSSAECVRQISCFNEGGRLVDGRCALGTCANEPSRPCGREFGDCPAPTGKGPVACERFADSCAIGELCNEGLDAKATLCPTSLNSSSDVACSVARDNGCTLDGCGGR